MHFLIVVGNIEAYHKCRWERSQRAKIKNKDYDGKLHYAWLLCSQFQGGTKYFKTQQLLVE